MVLYSYPNRTWRDKYPYLVTCKLKVLTLGFHLHPGDLSLKAFGLGRPRNDGRSAYTYDGRQLPTDTPNVLRWLLRAGRRLLGVLE